MRAFRVILAIGVLSCVIFACKEVVNGPGDKSGAIPAQVINPTVQNLPGAATISYTLPNDPSLYYVRAEYTTLTGVVRQVKASFYSNNVTLEGFPDSLQHDVRLYSVNRSEQESAPVIVRVKPQAPPISTIFPTLTLDADFGGVTAKYTNPTKANITIYIIVKDAQGFWQPVDNMATARDTGIFSVRGFTADKRRFGAYFRDRWLNTSDTLQVDLLPVFEKKLDKTKFKRVDLPTDYSVPNTAPTVMERLWNDNTSAGSDFLTKPSTVPGVGGIPQWFTFDLGVTAKLSRLIVYTRDNSVLYIYNSGTVKTWEIWGSNNPNPDGSWGSWTLLMLCQSVKPSGLPTGAYSADDLAYVRAGWEFNFPAGTPKVRYIRWKTLANWGGVTHFNATEATFYGSDQ